MLLLLFEMVMDWKYLLYFKLHFLSGYIYRIEFYEVETRKAFLQVLVLSCLDKSPRRQCG